MILEGAGLRRVATAALEIVQQQCDCEMAWMVCCDKAYTWSSVQSHSAAGNPPMEPGPLADQIRPLLPRPEEWPKTQSSHSELVRELRGAQWRRVGIEEVLATAIQHQGHCWGLLLALRQRPHLDNWTPEQRQILRYQADWISLAIEHQALQRNSEVLQSRQEALEAGRAKDAFLAAISHEIRTPMNGILGMADLLLGSGLDEEQLDCVQTIHSSCESLMQIINDILCFSKIESGSFELEQRSFDIRSCIEEVVDLLSEGAGQKGTLITYRCDHRVPSHIIGDRNRLRQILLNLAGNSVKFTAQGSIIISVSLESSAAQPSSTSPKNGQYKLFFQVKDTGIGISAELLPKLFQPFSQGKTKISGAGTGLGLVICRRLCHLMNGEIWAESTEHQGSCFTFTITAQADQELCKATTLQMQLSQAVHCLVISNQADHKLSIEDQLRFLGVTPISASNLIDAQAELLKTDAPQLIIIDDAVEPDYTGADWEKQLYLLLMGSRSHSDSSQLIILLTSHGRRLGEFQGLSSLPIHLLQKPTRLSQLANTLQQLLQVNQFTTEHPTPSAAAALDQSADGSQLARKELKILVVDDIPTNQKLASRMLERLGFSCSIVSDGREALDAIKDQHFDVVLMDIEMPVMNGLEATTRIRTLKQGGPQPWVIAMSAHARDEDRETCLKAGMDDYLSKPMTLQDLHDSLERCQPVSSNQAEAIDLSSWQQICDITGDNPIELIDLFLEDHLRLLEQIMSAHRHGNAQELSKACHALCSPSATIGAKDLAKYCRTTMEQIQNNQIKDAFSSANALLEESARVAESLQQLRQQYICSFNLTA